MGGKEGKEASVDATNAFFSSETYQLPYHLKLFSIDIKLADVSMLID